MFLFLFIFLILLNSCICVEPYYLKYFRLGEKDKALFNKVYLISLICCYFCLQYYQSFKNIANDPKEYIIKTNCSSNVDFEEKLGEREFIKGGNETVMIIYSNKNKIESYFYNYRECSLQYEEMNILMKLLFIKNKNINSNEYIIKFRENNNRNTELLNEIDYYLEEIQNLILSSSSSPKLKKTKDSNEVIDNEKIINLMKDTKEIRERIKRKSSKHSLKRQLNSSSYRNLKSDSSSMKSTVYYIIIYYYFNQNVY